MPIRRYRIGSSTYSESSSTLHWGLEWLVPPPENRIMLTASLFQIVSLPCVLMMFASAPVSAEGTTLDIEAIGRAAGTEATATADGVVRVGWLRNDVPVTIDGVPLPPAAGLGSWAAFKSLPGGKFMVMGDTVVFEDEITPAMDAAFAHGLEITALHNHFVFDRPPAYFMHIAGHADDPAVLAKGIRSMWDAIKRVRAERKMPSDRSSDKRPEITGNYDLPALNSILGGKGEMNGQVLKFTFERIGRTHGIEFGASMGLSTWAAFSGNADHAVVDGDFAMSAEEVRPVMHALRAAGIHIVALHNHMIGEEPPYYFLHYWGNGDTVDLARRLRSALDVMR